MSVFKVGDRVRVKNGVRLNDEPLENIIAEVIKVTEEYLFLKFNGKSVFRYVAHIKDCKKVY